MDLQRAIARGTLRLQLIPSDAHFSPLGPAQVQLPRAFAFYDQRFVPDAWALTQVTYDRILWPRRWTVEDWKAIVQEAPPRPDWTREHLVPRQ